MAYEIYQSRFTGNKIDEYLGDVPELVLDVGILKTSYDASKVKMADGSFLPDYLANTNFSIKLDTTTGNNVLVKNDNGYYVPKPDKQWIADSVAPANTDCIWLDTSNDTIKRYDSATSAWKEIGGVKFTNKDTLDKLSTSDEGTLLFDGQEIKGGDDTPHWTGTMAEYTAAASTVEDGSIVTILDDIAEGSSTSLSEFDYYSTDEKVVGCWIDGRPIYRKVFNVGTLQPSTSTQNIALTSDDPPISRVIRWNGTMIYGGTTPVGLPGSHNGYYESAVRYTENQLYLQYRNASTAKFQDTIISVDYTKTTDTENSFNPQLLSNKIGISTLSTGDIEEILNELEV